MHSLPSAYLYIICICEGHVIPVKGMTWPEHRHYLLCLASALIIYFRAGITRISSLAIYPFYAIKLKFLLTGQIGFYLFNIPWLLVLQIPRQFVGGYSRLRAFVSPLTPSY